MAEKIIPRIDGALKEIIYIQKEMAEVSFEDLNVSKTSCAYFSGNERSKQVIKKLGFIYYCSVLKDNETKLSLVNILTKEKWQRINKNIYN